METNAPYSDATAKSQSASLTEILGGVDAYRRLAVAFYARVEHEPVLRPLFPRIFRCPIDSLTYFLSQFFGDTGEYSRRRFSLSLREVHARFIIGQREREAWLRTMQAALEDIGVEEPARSALYNLFERSSAFLINHPAPLEEACDLPIELEAEGRTEGEPPGRSIHQELEGRWARQLALEEIVHAVRQGDASYALELTVRPIVQDYIRQECAVMLSLLALLGGSGNADLLDYVSRELTRDPALVTGNYAGGRILLHDAAGSGSSNFTLLLLRLGADPNAMDEAGHAPLYYAGNASPSAEERAGSNPQEVVRLLVQAGADVNARDGIKHCTALHMAARRDNVQVGEALLNHGADIEAHDSVGDTPLRRAVNCGQPEMVALLLSRGANVQARGSKGLTPWQAARGARIKQLLAGFREGVDLLPGTEDGCPVINPAGEQGPTVTVAEIESR